MKYKKSKFKSIVINIKKIKKFFLCFLIITLCISMTLSVNISGINIDFLKSCIISNYNFKNDIKNFSFTDEKALIKTALSYIELENENNKFKNEWINKYTDFKLIKNEKIEEKSVISDSISIKNETKYNIDTGVLLSEKPKFNLNKDKPSVLIVHTHTSESYTSNGEFETMDTDRTLDAKYNMVRIGEIFKETFEKNGIKTIHDKTIHDYPSYTSSYKRTLDTIEKYLKEYPTIEIVLDIHRDALIKEDGTKIKLVSDVKGKKSAQVMIVCGSDAGGLEFNTWKENLKFALQIQKNMGKDYPFLARPLLISENRYNMHKTKGSLLFEIGTNGNTIDEAINGAEFMAESVAKTILNLRAQN